MGHHQVSLAHLDRQSESLRVMNAVLKNKLRSSIPAKHTLLEMRIKEAVALELRPLNSMCQ